MGPEGPSYIRKTNAMSTPGPRPDPPGTSIKPEPQLTNGEYEVTCYRRCRARRNDMNQVARQSMALLYFGAAEHMNMNCPGGPRTPSKPLVLKGFGGPGASGTVHIHMFGGAK